MKQESIILIALLAPLSAVSVFAQAETEARDQIRAFAASKMPLVALPRIKVLKGSDKLSGEGLALALKSHWDALLKGPENAEKFWGMWALCSMIETSPERTSLVPELINLASELAPYEPKPKRERTWEDIGFEAWDGRLGIVMSSILRMEGPDGFTLMYNRFGVPTEMRKAKVLLHQILLRADGKKFLTILAETLSKEKAARCGAC